MLLEHFEYGADCELCSVYEPEKKNCPSGTCELVCCEWTLRKDAEELLAVEILHAIGESE